MHLHSGWVLRPAPNSCFLIEALRQKPLEIGRKQLHENAFFLHSDFPWKLIKKKLMSVALFVQLLISTHRLTSLFPVSQSRFLSNKSTSEPFAKNTSWMPWGVQRTKASGCQNILFFFPCYRENMLQWYILNPFCSPVPFWMLTMLFSVTQSQGLKFSGRLFHLLFFKQYFFKSHPVSFLPPNSMWSHVLLPQCSRGLRNVCVVSKWGLAGVVA